MCSSKSSPRDFSLFSLFTAGLACLTPFATAYTQPVGDSPEGNPIYTPGLHDIIPAGKAYTITWNPTTPGTVTLVLLKGPSNDAKPLYPIVEGTMNIGTYVWVPKDNLEPSNGDTGYGIQLIVDATGQYQYTTQFGISNDHYHAGGSSQSAWQSPSSSYGAASSSGYVAPTGYIPRNHTVAHPTGWKPHNTTHILPTGHTTWHTTHKMTHAPLTTSYAPAPSASKPPAASSTGGAVAVATSFAGLVFAAGMAAFAL